LLKTERDQMQREMDKARSQLDADRTQLKEDQEDFQFKLIELRKAETEMAVSEAKRNIQISHM
jgi:hypothetical protein